MPPQFSLAFSEHALDVFHHMALAREGDLRESLLVRQGRGSFHLSGAGHEGVAALAPHLSEGDLVFPAYRDRALMHAMGMTVEEMARDFFARETSSSGGRNLPGHFSSRRLGIVSITSPVGAQCLPAVGAAWARKMEDEQRVVLCHIGDAATRQGEFFEAVAQAIQSCLPVVFVVEDNGYGISTPTEGATPCDLGMVPDPILVRADGRDAEAVFLQGGAAIGKAREGGGPTVLWLTVDRLGSHTNADDHRNYRSEAVIQAMLAGDPLDRLAVRLEENGVFESGSADEARRSASDDVRDTYRRVEREPAPDVDAVEAHLYGPVRDAYPLSASPASATMLGAVNGMLKAGLAADSRMIVYGEDVEDPKGGVFGLTKGLSDRFPSQVVNSPLAEATIVGTAVGLAAAGWRPVFELQFIDFVGPAFNQLTAQVSNLRWRTKGEWTCPLTIVAPCGAYLPGGGMWHSQSNEGWFAGTPGLRVAVPSTPEDAAGLLWSSMHDSDPSLLLLCKHLLRAERASVPEGDVQAVPWGKGRIVREGTDVTLVTWGNCVEVAEAAADLVFAEDGTQVEIVDLRTLVPCDWDLVAASVGRTGRLVVVQEDSKTCGFGQAIVAEITTRTATFDALKAAPRLVSRPDVHIPFASELEKAILPSPISVAAAVRSTRTNGETEAVRSLPEHIVEAGVAEVTIPQLGEGLRRVRITAQLKNPGEWVAMDEPLYEAETDKANVVVESPFAGTLREWCVEVGQEGEVHGVLARIVTDPENAPSMLQAVVPTGYEELALSERQRAMTRSALGGRLDVVLPASVGRPIHWNLVEEARVRLRQANPRMRLTEFGIFAYAIARSTQRHPKFRSSIIDRGERMRRYPHVHLGFAVALPEDELTTAVVRDADRLSVEEFGAEMRVRHREAKNGVRQLDERTTLLISSLAGHDVIDAAPVLFPPAIATLFLGAPYEGSEGKVANVRLVFDHRLINGAGAADFLRSVEDELRTLWRGTEDDLRSID